MNPEIECVLRIMVRAYRLPRPGEREAIRFAKHAEATICRQQRFMPLDSKIVRDAIMFLWAYRP